MNRNKKNKNNKVNEAISNMESTATFSALHEGNIKNQKNNKGYKENNFK